jgi:hypothetical protein
MWSLDAIADAAADALRARDAALREEHAVYGLDAQQELSFHPLIADGLASAGFGVLREQPFPHEWFRKLRPDAKKPGLALPLPRDRMRCDLVLTPEPGQTLDDSLHTEKQRRVEEAELQGTLFESLSTSHLAPGSSNLKSEISNLKSRIPPESAFWLELKLCGQYTNTSGIPGPNRTYTSDLTRAPLADLKKLAEDHRIHHAGVLLIVFTENEQIARHDVAILAHRILDRNWPISSPILRSFPIPDRIGNTVCTVCLIGMRKD